MTNKTTEFTEAVEHLNRVVSLTDFRFPPVFSCVVDAAQFLLWSHRERGTQIRQSVYDYAIDLENHTLQLRIALERIAQHRLPDDGVLLGDITVEQVLTSACDIADRALEENQNASE